MMAATAISLLPAADCASPWRRTTATPDEGHQNDSGGGSMQLALPDRRLYVPGADPWVLKPELAFSYGKGREFYFFTFRRHWGSGDVGCQRQRLGGQGQAHGGGWWGTKLMLNFVPKGGRGGNDRRSNWIMHEYRLPDSLGGRRPPSSSSEAGGQAVRGSGPLQDLMKD